MIDYDFKNVIVYKLTKILDAVSCTLMTNRNVLPEHETAHGVTENKGQTTEYCIAFISKCFTNCNRL